VSVRLEECRGPGACGVVRRLGLRCVSSAVGSRGRERGTPDDQTTENNWTGWGNYHSGCGEALKGWICRGIAPLGKNRPIELGKNKPPV
jgi:hypothetical protein